MATAKEQGEQLVLDNRRARFDYDLGERFEAGLVLVGSEVKVLRKGSGDLTDGWVDVRDGQAWLKGAFIPRLEHAAWSGHVETRERKLLLHAHEIASLHKALGQDRATVVPLRIYWKGGRAKVELAVAKGKNSADKRQSIKQREGEREARAAILRGRDR